MGPRESQIEFYHKLAPNYDRVVDAQGIRGGTLYRDLFPPGSAFRRGLDLGCGTGNWTQALVDVCESVVAVVWFWDSLCSSVCVELCGDHDSYILVWCN